MEGYEEAGVLAEQVGAEQANAFRLQAGMTSDTHTECTWGIVTSTGSLSLRLPL